MRIGFYPRDPDFFYNLKQNLDEGVYERSDFARPHLKEVSITGAGADPGEVEVQNDGSKIGIAIAQADGTFSFYCILWQKRWMRLLKISLNKSRISIYRIKLEIVINHCCQQIRFLIPRF